MNSSLSLETINYGTNIISQQSLIWLQIIILIFCLPLNLYVVWLITTGAGNAVSSELFALNLSVCEIIICLSAFPSVFYFSHLAFNPPSALIYTVRFLATVLAFGRPLFQCCVCVERYVAVVYPVVFLKFKPLKYRVISSAAVWLTVLGICAYSTIPPVRFLYYYIMLPIYVFLLFIKGFCSIAVLKALRRPGPGEKWSAKAAEANRMKKKAFWVILIILVTMIFTYGPVVIYIFLFDSLTDYQRWNGSSVYSYIFLFAGLVQPLLFLHRIGKIPFIRSF